jgi:hypothetical protein
MKKYTLIKHKEVVVVYEENGPISLNYDVLLTTPKANIVIKSVVPLVIAKASLTCANCGERCHTFETCHNRKREV